MPAPNGSALTSPPMATQRNLMNPRRSSTGSGSIVASTSGIRQATGASSPAGASGAGCGSAWPSEPSAAGCSGTAGLSGWFCSLISTLSRAEVTTWPSGLRVKNALGQAEIQFVTAAGAPKDRPLAVGDLCKTRQTRHSVRSPRQNAFRKRFPSRHPSGAPSASRPTPSRPARSSQ